MKQVPKMLTLLTLLQPEGAGVGGVLTEGAGAEAQADAQLAEAPVGAAPEVAEAAIKI